MSNRETTAAQKEAIAGFCQQHHARRLTWLDKPLRSGPDADREAALLIEFNPADVPSLSRLVAMEEEISRILGRSIDLHLYLRELYLGYGPREAGIVYDRADYVDIPIPREKIAEFCKRKKVRWLAKFPYPSRASVIDYADVEFLAGLAPGAEFTWGALDGWKELDEILGCETAMDYAKELPPTLR
jgi:predicted nucleotidyltransferase